VTLTAIPNEGYAFSNWSGDASGSTNPLSISMNGNKNITANFTTTSSDQQQVTSFILVDSKTEQDIMAVGDGAVIALSSLKNTKLNVRAETSPASVGSVKFELS